MKLSERHREQFVDQGYVVVEGALTDGDLQPVIDDYSAIVADLAKKLHAEGRISRLHEEEPFDTRLARICDEDEETYFDSDEFLDVGQARPRGTFEFMRNGNLLDLVEGFVGPEISCNSISHIRAKLPSGPIAEQGFQHRRPAPGRDLHHSRGPGSLRADRLVAADRGHRRERLPAGRAARCTGAGSCTGADPSRNTRWRLCRCGRGT